MRFLGRRVYFEFVFVLACVLPGDAAGCPETSAAPTCPAPEVAAAPEVSAAPEVAAAPVVAAEPAPAAPSPGAPEAPPILASAPTDPSPPPAAPVFGVPERTLTRWRKWWREDFPKSQVGRELQARLMPPIAPAALPGGLLGRYSGSLQERVLRLLNLLLPLSVTGPRAAPS